MIIADRNQLGRQALPGDVVEILELTKEKTGKGIDFREQAFGLTDTWASVKIAEGDMANHIVLYHPDHEDKLGYLVAHECGHILRLHEAPPDYRKLPATGSEHRRRVVYELKDDLYRLEGLGLSAGHLGQLVSMWHEGLVRQLGNVPVDVRIENWLHNEYSGLRPLQHRALRAQLRENEKVLERRVKEFTPEKVYHASNVINAAYARFMGAMLDQPSHFAAYHRTPYEPPGRRLGDELWESPDRGYRGDMEAIERWSQLLGLDGWWEWRNVFPERDG